MKYQLPPRQKMINLLYVVLIAMLAINVSSDTLNGYLLLNQEAKRQGAEQQKYNEIIYSEAVKDSLYEQLADSLKYKEQDLLHTIDRLQVEIARLTDLDEYTSVDELKKKEDLNAVPQIMLARKEKEATHLKQKIDDLRQFLVRWLADKNDCALVESKLYTQHTKKLISWEVEMFGNQSSIGGITLLNTMKKNIMQATGIGYKALAKNMIVELETPEEETDTLPQQIWINDEQQILGEDGTLETPVGLATSSKTNFLYADMENEVDLLIVGIPSENLQMNASSATLSRAEDAKVLITPHHQAKSVVLTVTDRYSGREILKKEFRVKEQMQANISLTYTQNGESKKYLGNVPIGKELFSEDCTVNAEIPYLEDQKLNVQSFDLVLVKENKTLHSNSNRITAEQAATIHQLEKGESFYITNVKITTAKGKSVPAASIQVLVY